MPGQKSAQKPNDQASFHELYSAKIGIFWQVKCSLTRLSAQYSYQTRSMVNRNLFIPANHLMAEQRSLRYAGSKLWNVILYEIRHANSLNSFKIKLNAYLLEQDIN